MKKLMVLSGILALSMTNLPAQAMGIVGGDVIKLDFSTAGNGDGGSLADWNQVGGSTPITSVRRQGGSFIDGVSISFTNLIDGRFNNDPASGNWGGTNTDPFYIRGADDIYFHGSTNDLSVTFNGLDATLDYKVRIYSLINGQSTLDTFVVTDGSGFQTVSNTRNFRWNATTLEAGGTVFNDLQLNSSNQLVIRVQDQGSIYYPLNAIVVQAVGRTSVPEPSIWLLLGTGLLGMLSFKRKK